jgi:diguanylate cyclase (GGDEF)-like protein
VSTRSPAARSEPDPGQVAKAWLTGVVERTPLDRVSELDLELLAAEAVPLVAAILDALDAPSGELGADVGRRASMLRRLRPGDRACAEAPRDLAVLQSVLIGSVGSGEGARRRFAGPGLAPQRLAELFGSLHGSLAESLVAERDLPGRDRPEALPGRADLDQWLDVLVAEHRRYGRPFALALLELKGLGRIIDTHGRRPGELMLTAATTVIRNQIRIVDRAFALDDGGFCVLAPNVDADRLRRMADRVARVVQASQAADAPRIAISAGISGCPEHGQDGGRLLAIAGDALGAAKASGEPVQVALNGARSGSPA